MTEGEAQRQNPGRELTFNMEKEILLKTDNEPE